jgi:hypothetical protein
MMREPMAKPVSAHKLNDLFQSVDGPLNSQEPIVEHFQLGTLPQAHSAPQLNPADVSNNA